MTQMYINTDINRLDKLEREFSSNLYTGADEKGPSYIYKRGRIPVMLSAPHTIPNQHRVSHGIYSLNSIVHVERDMKYLFIKNSNA